MILGHLSASKSTRPALCKYALNSSLIPARSIKFFEGHSQGRTGASLGGSSSASHIASLGPCFLEEPPWNIFLSILFFFSEKFLKFLVTSNKSEQSSTKLIATTYTSA